MHEKSIGTTYAIDACFDLDDNWSASLEATKVAIAYWIALEDRHFLLQSKESTIAIYRDDPHE